MSKAKAGKEKTKQQEPEGPINIRCLVLKGHERPITFVKYNRDGDILFTTSKDKGSMAVTAWWTDNGERMGTYEGHNGAVWGCDVNWSTTRLITGSGDQTAKLWDVKTGKQLYSWNFRTAVRSVSFSLGDAQMLAVNDTTMGQVATIYVYNLSKGLMEGSDASRQEDVPRLELVGHEKKINHAVWGPLNKTIISCSDDCTIRIWDAETGKQLQCVQAHTKEINRIQLSKDGYQLVSASADYSAKLWDIRDMTCLKTYDTTRPVRDAAISPLMDHVIVGGGQAAHLVTTTVSRSGQFQVRFYHKVLEEEVATVKGHFGPVNALAFSPDGKGFTSGGEDGYVRMHQFDASYLKSKDVI